MDAIKYCKRYCIRFDFGLPLEDIFPPNDIHPQLKNLFCETYLSLAKISSDNNLADILNTKHGSLCEKLDLKECLVSGNLHIRDEVNAGTYLWIIRHFLGLLPLPLFPKYTNGKYFDWEAIAIMCRKNTKNTGHMLQSEILRNMNLLPNCNIILLDLYFAFTKEIVAGEYLNKNLLSITTYFCSTLFLRPYRPGFVHKDEKLYYDLFYYFLINWRTLRTKRLHFKFNLHEYFNENRYFSFNYYNDFVLSSSELSSTFNEVSEEKQLSMNSARSNENNVEKENNKSNTNLDADNNMHSKEAHDYNKDESILQDLKDKTFVSKSDILNTSEKELKILNFKETSDTIGYDVKQSNDENVEEGNITSKENEKHLKVEEFDNNNNNPTLNEQKIDNLIIDQNSDKLSASKEENLEKKKTLDKSGILEDKLSENADQGRRKDQPPGSHHNKKVTSISKKKIK